MKTTIKITDNGTVTISYDTWYGDRITRSFFVPANGGYVREHSPNFPQVCERLAGTGSTLHAVSRAALPDVIRREYRRMRRAERSNNQR